jgi:hypothetical protein
MNYLRVSLEKEDVHWQRQLELSRHEQRRLDDQKVGILETTPLGSLEPPRTTPLEDPKWDRFLRRNLSEWYLQVHYPHLLTESTPTDQQTQQLRDIWTDDREEKLII